MQVARRRHRAARHWAVVVTGLIAALGLIAAAGAGGSKSVTNYVAYVNGKPGPAHPKLSPILVGYVNQEGGPIVIGKTADDGVNIAVKWINSQAGGIGGHPLKIVTCWITQSEEEGQKCGQKFANNNKIVAIVTGAVGIGNESMFAAIGGAKPVIIGVSINPVERVQKNAGIFGGDAAYILAPYATFARDVLHTKTAALVFPEGAGLDSAAAGQTSAFVAAGIKIKKVSYPANTADLTVPLVAAGAQSADLVMPVINPNECGKFEKAIQALNIPESKVLASPICLTPSTIQELGDFPKWIYAVGGSLTTDTSDPAVPPYQKILKTQGQAKFIGDPWVGVGFFEVLTAAKFLNKLGPTHITTAGVLKQMHEFKGPLVLGSPAVHCGKYPKAPAVCNDHTQFYRYLGKGAFKKAGDWVPPPKGWVAPNG
jgi:branched-chain amino acid transport system substrate-binding protein